MINERDILAKTNYGLNIYAHILQQYYPNELVVHLSGKECKQVRNPFNENKPTLELNNVDEAHRLKNHKARVFKNAAMLCRHLKTEFLFALTGTPMANKSQELWTLS